MTSFTNTLQHQLKLLIYGYSLITPFMLLTTYFFIFAQKSLFNDLHFLMFIDECTTDSLTSVSQFHISTDPATHLRLTSCRHFARLSPRINSSYHTQLVFQCFTKPLLYASLPS